MKEHFKFFIRTYGCRVNQYESQSIREHWLALGGEETVSARDADVILVSTCAVTAQAVSGTPVLAFEGEHGPTKWALISKGNGTYNFGALVGTMMLLK